MDVIARDHEVRVGLREAIFRKEYQCRLMTTCKLNKKQVLRNNEYYGTQEIFDDLYRRAKKGESFHSLLEIIESKENILLAYRNIKKNKGSKTHGTNKTTIVDVGNTDPDRLIQYVRNRLRNYVPQPVRRKEIEKENGKKRPLGIPTIEDRLIQQCIKQVLEPICEAQFYEHSYGFRPNRGTHHAIARMNFLTYKSELPYVVDVDIKGFFDNVNHAKLMKQMWNMGIQDKNLLCIVSKMLKAEIKGIGIPDRGTPQGGILSPLLSNIVLNELDWWIASQWEKIPTEHQYANNSKKKRALKGTRLKEVYIVRYADDFKLLCRTRSCANRIFLAVQQWLKDRLGLDINLEKSGIVNIKKRYTDFLGIKMRLRKKGNGYVTTSRLMEKSIVKCKKKLSERVDEVKREQTPDSVHRLNACTLGLHNYFSAATLVSRDFASIAFCVNSGLKSRTKSITSKKGQLTKAFKKFYGHYTGKPTFMAGIPVFPMHLVKFRAPPFFNPETCNYTIPGRARIHDQLKSVEVHILRYLMEHPVREQSTEYNDNRISLYVAQQGKCYITKEPLRISQMEAHHKEPRDAGGTDAYDNLAFVSTPVHRLIHATEKAVIESCLAELKTTVIDYNRLNKLRKLVGRDEIHAG